MLEAEIQSIQKDQAANSLSSEEFAKIWEDCSSELVFIPSQQKYGKFSTSSKADKIESLRNQLEVPFLSFLFFFLETKTKMK